MKIHELIADDRNANKGTKRGRKAINDSLARYGAGRSILIDRDGRVIAGNKTASNAAVLGNPDVLVVRTDGTQLVAVQRTDLSLDDPKARELAIADNRTSELGLEWDADVFGDLTGDLDLKPFFTDGELKDLLPATVNEIIGDEDYAPEAPAEPVTKLGDIYLLGDHRLMCGDSTCVTDVERLMDGDKADALFTDPPYNIAFKPQRGTHDAILNDDLGDEEFDDFLDGVFSCALAAMKPDTFAFIWTGWFKLGAFERAIRRAFKIQAFHVWVKNNFGIGYYSRPKHEPFYLPLNGRPPYPATAPADVWEHAKVHQTIHSCEKPVGLIVDILDSYCKGGIILDLFGGSGSTLIACEKTGRRARLMELDPKYCDVIVARWEKATGKKAVLHGRTQTDTDSQ